MTELRGKGGALIAEDARIAIDFEGQALSARRGETLAAALSAAGIRELRLTRRGEPRGIFCGMGVCQECLVEIDGRANQRACMTKLERPVAVRCQRHLAAAAAESPAGSSDAVEILAPDILVLGGGAGGLNAATAASRAGAKVLLIDERPEPGGQFYKQPLPIPALAEEAASDPQFAGGRALIAAAQAAGVEMRRGAQLWGAFEPLDLMLFDGAASRLCRPKRLIVAAGAYERALPLPGWTLPGVMTTGAAQTLLRSYRVLAGRRVLLAGNGPLNIQVALELARAGAEVLAVAELAPRPGPWALPALAKMLTATPALALRGWRQLAEMKRRGIALLYGSVLAAVAPGAGGLTAEVKSWPAGDGVQRFEVDAVAMGYGFLPSNEILRALGCAHRFDPARGHLVTERDGKGRTSIPEIYAVGDCAGLGGAPAAEAEGIIAGLTAARSLGFAAAAGQAEAEAAARAALGRHRRFQAGLWDLFRAPRLLSELAAPDTLICRCEELSRAEIEAGLAPGAETIGAVKRQTRCGMGRCQGRYCGPIIAALAAQHRGEPLTEASHWAPRPPIKPIHIGDITN
ncbi:MAG TPA: FAD-dependent oxidoreductase [Dongiaceae bacterium]|nr:FAD-dependent oxidoreductase [Dongiaceae bacterium]